MDEVTITPEYTGHLEPGDVLTCSADGYNPTYTWTGVVNGEIIDTRNGSLYTLLEGDFEVQCTATVDEVTCIDKSFSVEGSAFGEYRIALNTVVRMLMLVTLSVFCKLTMIIFTASNAYFGNTHHVPYLARV